MTDFKVGDRVEVISNGHRGRIVDIDEGYGAYGKASIDLDSSYGTWAHSLVDIRALESSAEATLFEQSVRYHTNKIADLLIAKNKQYSNSALDPIRVFSKSDRQEQLRVRADDKLSRIRNGDTSEDAITDLCGYLILMKIAEESE